MRRMHDEMDRVFGDAFGSRFSANAMGGGLAAWSPAVEVTDDALVIEGERKQEHEEKQGGKWHSERRYGRFHRTIPLPEGASAEQARADFKNGELRVTVPIQRPESKRRQIPIGSTASDSGKK